MGNRRINLAGLEIIKSEEGFVPHAYYCPAGVLTIGYGFTKGVKLGQTISREEAERRLIQELEEYEEGVSEVIKVGISENQFSALVSFTFNIGVTAFAGSTLARMINQGKITEAADQFDRWIRGGGRILSGLIQRRNREKTLYLTPDTPNGTERAIKITKPTFFKRTTFASSHPSNDAKVTASVGTRLPILASKFEKNHYRLTFGSYQNGIKQDVKIANRNTWYLFHEHFEFLRDSSPSSPGNTLARQVAKLCEEKEYPLNKGEYNLIGISGLYPVGNREETYELESNTLPNLWNDSIGIIAYEGEFEFICLYRATTEPGKFYTMNPINRGGVACLDWGYHENLWTFGRHSNYEALVQAGRVRLVRDKNKNYLRDERISLEVGNGVNLHTAFGANNSIGRWSAGCCVVKSPEEFKELLTKLKESPQYKNDRSCRFDFRLLSASWL